MQLIDTCKAIFRHWKSTTIDKRSHKSSSLIGIFIDHRFHQLDTLGATFQRHLSTSIKFYRYSLWSGEGGLLSILFASTLIVSIIFPKGGPQHDTDGRDRWNFKTKSKNWLSCSQNLLILSNIKFQLSLVHNAPPALCQTFSTRLFWCPMTAIQVIQDLVKRFTVLFLCFLPVWKTDSWNTHYPCFLLKGFPNRTFFWTVFCCSSRKLTISGFYNKHVSAVIYAGWRGWTVTWTNCVVFSYGDFSARSTGMEFKKKKNGFFFAYGKIRLSRSPSPR